MFSIGDLPTQMAVLRGSHESLMKGETLSREAVIVLLTLATVYAGALFGEKALQTLGVEKSV